MIPIKLTLQGIYSYQEKQSIDFTKLTEANLFGIFGSVGSGKSTILEAITYALYGNTDRLNQKGDNRNYNMMNLKSNDLFIEFIFRTGKDDTEYMATVKGRRNSKQFEDVKVLERKAYKRLNGEWQPIETEDFANIIGLSYENFKRTVIIPQGRFQEFLQLGNSDRTKMMKELFNLEKFELFYKVVSLESKNNQKITSLQGQMIQLGDINPDQIKVLEDTLTQLKFEIEQKTQNLQKQQKQEERLRNLKELSEKIVKASQVLADFKSREPEFTLLEKAIREYDYCQLNFKNLFESAKNCSEKIAFYDKNIQTDQNSLTVNLQQLKELESNFSALKTAFDSRETYNQQAEELDKIAKIHELNLLCQQTNVRLTNGEKEISNTETTIRQLQESKTALIASVKEIKELMPDMALLAKVKNWFTFHNTLIISQKGLLEELKELQNGLQDIENQKTQLWKENGLSNVPLKESDSILEENKLQLRKNIENMSKEMEHLSVQIKLEEYAANLEEGHPCPLCGALTHPQRLNAQSVSEALQKLKNQKSEIEKNQTALETLQKKISELNTILKLKQELQHSNLLKQTNLNHQIAEHQKLFTWEAYKEENTVNEAFETANKLQQQLKSKETELDTATKLHEKEVNNKDKFDKALEEFRHLLTAKSSEIATLTSQLILLKLSDFINKTSEEIQTLKTSCLLHYQKIGTAYTTANDKINALGKERYTLNGRLEANRQVLEQEKLLQKNIDFNIQAQLGKSDYSTREAVEVVLTKSMNTEAEKTKLTQYRESLKNAENQLSLLQKELGDQKYDPEKYQQEKEILAQMQEDLSLSTLNQGKLSGELEKLKTDFESRKTLIELKNTLESRAEDLKTLKQLFKASGFVNYISSVYLQELCRAGNDRFYKLTRQKLSLEVTEDNNFQVRDFMNGGKTRNVKTLSGGQTFQAALSLALALADNIQKITESNQNFFFLDEGFGSLDKESLDVVFDTLKSLRKENRIVGVISHVEEMQQEIDTHLKIVNHEERGSLITPSWI